jgi:hypothetical protein
MTYERTQTAIDAAFDKVLTTSTPEAATEAGGAGDARQ